MAGASHMYASDVETAIRAHAAAFRTTWEEREPEAVANCFADLDKTLPSVPVDLPRGLISLIRTTNLLERCHKERRRTQRESGMVHSARGCAVPW